MHTQSEYVLPARNALTRVVGDGWRATAECFRLHRACSAQHSTAQRSAALSLACTPQSRTHSGMTATASSCINSDDDAVLKDGTSASMCCCRAPRPDAQEPSPASVSMVSCMSWSTHASMCSAGLFAALHACSPLDPWTAGSSWPVARNPHACPGADTARLRPSCMVKERRTAERFVIE